MPAMPRSTPSRGGSPRRLGAALLGLLHDHLALLGEELQEQKGRALGLVVLALSAMLFALLLIIGLSALLLIGFWDSHRLIVGVGLCLFYALAGGACLTALLARLRSAPSPFGASLEELRRDREQLLP